MTDQPPAIRNQPAIHAPTYVAYDYEDPGSNNGHWHIYTTDQAPDFVELSGASVLVIRAAQTDEMRAAIAAICDRIDAAIAVAVKEGLRDAGTSLVIPACGIEGRNDFVTKARSFVIAHNGGGCELLAVELSACSSQRRLLLRREVSWQLCGSHPGESFFSKHRFSLEIGGLCRAALIFFLLVLCSLGSSHAFGGGNKFISAQSVEMGQDFATTQEKQACDAKPKVETAPPASAFSRIPTRQPTHDSLPIFMALGAAFLVGFKMAGHMHSR